MKKILAVVLCLALALCLTACGDPAEKALEKWDDDGVLKVLAIGNSFSVDTFEYAYDIAKSAGVEKIVLGNLYVGGCSVDGHVYNAQIDAATYEYYTNTDGKWNAVGNYKMGDAIKAENWDYISMQQVSGQSGQPEAYELLPKLVEYVKENANKDATFVWNMTWAYGQTTTHEDFAAYDSDQMTMYEAIVDTVNEKIVDNKDFAIVIPSGTAIQNGRTSFIGDDFTRDGYHLSYDLGRYVAGLTLVKQLTGKSIDDIEFAPEGVTDEQKAVAIESANNAVENPFEVTQSKNK